ncbi:MAG TPA: arginase [Gemmatimonadales bacterium]|nr:arginase [Gemmatimonadales bacterium]
MNKLTQSRTIHVIGVPMDLGAGRRGVDMGPSAIRIAGLVPQLQALGRRVIDQGDLPISSIERLAIGDPHARFLKEIMRVNRRLAEEVQRVVRRGHFPLVLGGDHSIAVGTVSGVAAHARRRGRKVGIVWVDAHSDINTPRTSPSGNVHGMPLAALLGLAPASLGAVGGGFRKVDPGNVALVGIRSVDEGERAHLRRLGVQVFTMADIDRIGIHGVMEQAIENVTHGTDFVHVSFDLDAVDPSLAPGVGTPVKGGLDYREAHFVMESLCEAGIMTSLEIVEVNPILDDRNASARFAVELLQSAFGKRIL